MAIIWNGSRLRFWGFAFVGPSAPENVNKDLRGPLVRQTEGSPTPGNTGNTKYLLSTNSNIFDIDVSSIPSAEAFGTANANLTVFPGSIASAEAIGTVTVGFLVFVNSIASAEAIGQVTATTGPVTDSPTPFWYVFHTTGAYPFWYPIGKFPYGPR